MTDPVSDPSSSDLAAPGAGGIGTASHRRVEGRALILQLLRRTYRLLFMLFGQWRAALLTRFFGFVLLLLEGERVWSSLLAWKFRTPNHSTVIGVVGLVLVLFGPRLVALVFSVGASGYFLYGAVTESRGHLALLADEYLLYFTIPFLMVVFGGVEWVRLMRKGLSVSDAARHADVDDAVTVTLRIHILVTLFFAGFHKMNTDFFNPKASCMSLSRRLITWWSIPRPLIDLLAPWHIAFGEALAPVILMLSPRVGVLVIIFMVSGFAHIGPVAFASCCITLALAFMRLSDGAVLKRAYARFGLLLIPLSVLLCVASYSAYDGNRVFFRFYIYQLFVLNVLFMIGALLAEDLRVFRRGKQWGMSTWSALAFGFGPVSMVAPTTPPDGLPSSQTPVVDKEEAPRWGALSLLNWPRLRAAEFLLLPRTKIVQVLVVVALVVHVANGFSPYMGFKYRLSYAMLSNLRVDDYRWNHYVMPEWSRIYPRDGLLHLVAVDVPKQDRKRAKQKKLHLRRGLAVGWHLEKVLRKYRRAGVHVDITIDDDGMKTRYVDAPFHPDLRRRLSEERTYGRMFQKNLRLKGVQSCVH